jgi:hypothetical protein
LALVEVLALRWYVMKLSEHSKVSVTQVPFTDGVQAFIAVQNAVKPGQIPLASAILIFFQNFGSSVAGVLANVIFTETIVEVIPRYAHSISPQDVLNTGSGAAALRNLVSEGQEEDMEGVLRAYSKSLRNVFYFVTGLAALATLVSLGMGWKDVRKQKSETIATEKEDTGVDSSK